MTQTNDKASLKVKKHANNNEKIRSIESKENIHEKEFGPYRGFGH